MSEGGDTRTSWIKKSRDKWDMTFTFILKSREGDVVKKIHVKKHKSHRVLKDIFYLSPRTNVPSYEPRHRFLLRFKSLIQGEYRKSKIDSPNEGYRLEGRIYVMK